MKGFRREHLQFSLCGLNCALCSMHLGGYCPGCGGGEGNQSCAIARCGVSRGVEFCCDCGGYPCEKYEGFGEYDSFVPRSNGQRDMERARSIGLDTYLAELDEKAALYHHLVEAYNDGRRKTFFSTAVYLLALADLRSVTEALSACVSEHLSAKERAALAVSAFQAMADTRGISLKLNKKPKE